MSRGADFLLMLILLFGLGSLGSSLVGRLIRVVAAQGIAVGALLVVSHWNDLSARLVAVAAATIMLKGLVMPWVLNRSIREAKATEEVEPYVGYTLSLMLGAVAIGVAFGIARLLELPGTDASKLVVPVSLATVFNGMLLLVTRRKAVSQVAGYLVLENGIYVFSLALASSLPVLIEMGVLLDVFVAVFVMGITIYQINREFDHIDASKLRGLHDLTTRGARLVTRRPPNNGREGQAGTA